ncbi:MAG TPA: MerR family transcriptional regulator [Acidimicrobiales bacterium]|nr:MerR family transcriptional regulator [Acidimicrobiales bacterium]
MKISALSTSTGVPVPTIKYYLREGLLEPGRQTAPNQADYGDAHAHRLRLIRVLIEVGGLGVASVRAVLDAIADAELPVHDLLGVAHQVLGPPPDHGPAPRDVAEARAEVDAFLVEQGWRIDAVHPARRALADALVALRRLGRDVGVEVFRPYAEVADRLAAQELRTVPPASRADAVEAVVVGTVVFEAALMALRRLAQAHHSALRFSGPTSGGT